VCARVYISSGVVDSQPCRWGRALERPTCILPNIICCLGAGLSLRYAFILAVCVIWVGGSFLVESLAGLVC